MQRLKYILYALLLCAFMYGGFRIYKRLKTRHEVLKVLNSEPYKNKLASFNDNLIDSSSIVFIGNSLTDNFDLSQFQNPRLLNYGISGDFTRGLISRINPVLKKHPAKMFIEIGINDLIEQVPQQTMLKNYDTILHRIITLSPRTAIFVQSLLPTRASSLLTPMAKVNGRIMEFNAKLQQLAKKYNATYVNLWSLYAMPDNSMNPDLTWDNIHLTKQGYSLWANFIKELVN